MEFIRRLRSKPSHVRTRYAFLLSGAITGIITMFWMSSLPAQLSELSAASDETPTTEEESGLSDLLGETRDQFGTIIESTKELEEITSGNPSNLGSLGNPETTVESEGEQNVETPAPAQKPVPTTPKTAPPSNTGPRTVLIGTTTISQ